MEFKDNEPIYLQIAAWVCDNILIHKWPAEQKIPSVRDLAVELEVNPNTVMRAYEYLQTEQIIYNKRGLGLFVAPAGFELVKKLRREKFMQQNLPELFKDMYLLDILMKEIADRYEEFKNENYGALANHDKNENKH